MFQIKAGVALRRRNRNARQRPRSDGNSAAASGDVRNHGDAIDPMMLRVITRQYQMSPRRQITS